jgi:ribonuclease P protein component
VRDRGTNPVVAVQRLIRRNDFRAASTGAQASAKAFVLQVRQRGEDGPARVGFTVSRQVGNAVERNRVRRRLREIVRLTADGVLRAGHDYVLIGRRTALAVPFAQMRQELDAALGRIHGGGAVPSRRQATGGARKQPLHESGSPQPQPRRQPRKG